MTTIAGTYSVSCMDPRERVVEARYAKLHHLLDMLQCGAIAGPVAEQVLEIQRIGGTHAADLAVNPYRNARGGGGWSLDSRDDLEIIKENDIPLLAVYSTRHRLCAAIGKDKHLKDYDIATMIVEDFEELGMDRPPAYRAHLEVITKHEEIEREPMNLEALVAYAIVYGTSAKFRSKLYCPHRAAEILGIASLSRSSMQELAHQAAMSPKGLVEPIVEFASPSAH